MGRAWVERRRDKWVVIARDGGKRRTISPSVDETQAKAIRDRHNARSGLATATMAELIDHWAAEKRHSKHARAVQRVLAKVLQEQGWSKPAHITYQAIVDWNVERGGRSLELAGTNTRMPIQYLRTILRWAHQQHGAPVDQRLLERGVMPRAKRRPRRPLLTSDQITAIRLHAATMGTRAAALIEYLTTYGARPITATQLRQADLDVDRSTLTIQDAKHSGGWTHPVSQDQAERWSDLWPEADGPLFPHWREDRAWRISQTRGYADEMGNWYRATIVRQLAKQDAVAAHTIYDLKRYAITAMLDRGLDPATVATFTGHLDVGQVLTYNRTNEERQANALAQIIDAQTSAQTAKTED